MLQKLTLFISALFISLDSIGQLSEEGKTWSEARESGKAQLLVYWYTSQPFIYKGANGELTGIEYEIIDRFADFIGNKYGVDISIRWVQPGSFKQAYELIANPAKSGIIAASAFSITEKRRQAVDFTTSYMSDISVLISHKDVPVVASLEEFDQVFRRRRAITIEGTTYEDDLINMSKSRDLDFEIHYIPSIENVLKTIEKEPGSFGFIDLPIYLKEFKENTEVGVNRQNFFTIKREGLAFPVPKNSDWKKPLDEFLQSDDFKNAIVGIISKYLDYEVYSFVESVYQSPLNEVNLLKKEKELQRRELSDKTARIEREERLRNISIISAIIILIFLVTIFFMYRNSKRTTQLLREQKFQISRQNENIQRQKEELEIQNKALNKLNSEKNNLINILAHDLRSPINHIHGLASILLMDSKRMDSEKRQVTEQILESSKRLSSMITKILDIDSIESNNSPVSIEKIDLDQFAKDITREFEREAHKKDINLQVINRTEMEYLNTDKFYLRQIIENLVSNAIKFSPLGKVVFFEIREEENDILFAVTDEGPGLTASDIENLFKKYQRLSAKPTAGEQSTGLGLSIVKKYTEVLGGKIECESEPGKGATFTLRLSKKQDAV